MFVPIIQILSFFSSFFFVPLYSAFHFHSPRHHRQHTRNEQKLVDSKPLSDPSAVTNGSFFPSNPIYASVGFYSDSKCANAVSVSTMVTDVCFYNPDMTRPYKLSCSREVANYTLFFPYACDTVVEVEMATSSCTLYDLENNIYTKTISCNTDPTALPNGNWVSAGTYFSSACVSTAALNVDSFPRNVCFTNGTASQEYVWPQMRTYNNKDCSGSDYDISTLDEACTLQTDLNDFSNGFWMQYSHTDTSAASRGMHGMTMISMFLMSVMMTIMVITV